MWCCFTLVLGGMLMVKIGVSDHQHAPHVHAALTAINWTREVWSQRLPRQGPVRALHSPQARVRVQTEHYQSPDPPMPLSLVHLFQGFSSPISSRLLPVLNTKCITIVHMC
jgi:hypothetical protein